MADLLSINIVDSVMGLTKLASEMLDTKRYTAMPEKSIEELQRELDNLRRCLSEMQQFIWDEKKFVAPDRWAMISVWELTTSLSFCVLIVSRLDERLREIGGTGLGVNDEGLTTEEASVGRPIAPKDWQEAEAANILEILSRSRLSLQLMLGILQGETDRARGSAVELRQNIDFILGSENQSSAQLRDILRRQDKATPKTEKPQGISRPSSPEVPGSPKGATLDHDSPLASRPTVSVWKFWTSRATQQRGRRGRNAGRGSSGTSISRGYKSAQSNTNSCPLSESKIPIAELQLPICLLDVWDPRPFQRVISSKGPLMDLDLPYNGSGQTPLIQAICKGRRHESICRLLLDRGANVNAVDSVGRTPLIHAAERGREGICKLLLGRGANVNATDNNNLTALALAAHEGHVVVCCMLLGREASTNSTDSTGMTPLVHAVDQYRESACRLLLARGAETMALKYFKQDSKIKELHGRIEHALEKKYDTIFNLLISVLMPVPNPLPPRWLSERLHLAIEKDERDISILETLVSCMKHIDEKEQTDEHGRTPLVHAIFLYRGTICQLLYDNGARVRKPTGIPLEHNMINKAIDSGSKLIVQLLLEMGADMEEEGSFGMTPLLYAIYQGNGEIAKYLIHAGANPEARDSGDWSVIHCAVSPSAGSPDVLRDILATEARSLVDAINADGETPLHFCAQHKEHLLAKVLVENGHADLTARNGFGRTAYQEAVMVGNTTVARYLWSQLPAAQQRLQGPPPAEWGCETDP